jgi:hypothetical protein
VTMVWATTTEVRAAFAAGTEADGATEWPALPEADTAVNTLIVSASRALAVKVIRWPILDDTDRPEDTEQRSHILHAVCEVIRDRRLAATAVAELGGQAAAGVIAGGGSVKAGNLEVRGGNSGGWLADRSRVPVDAVFALQAAGLIGGSVPTW